MSALIAAIKRYLRNHGRSLLARAIRFVKGNRSTCLWWVARYGLSGAVRRVVAAVR